MRPETMDLPNPVVIEPQAHSDQRGHFYESFNAREFERLVGTDVRFVQDNQSRSVRNVLRGLHFQVEPWAQGKLVRVVRGSVFDVAVDVRRSSPGFGDWIGLELSEDNRKQLWVPAGFAHGFLALTDFADVLYKVTDYYSSDHDRSIRWDDPEIGIDWPIEDEPLLSDKDAAAPYLRDAEVFA